MQLDADRLLLSCVATGFNDPQAARIGIAVSGGGDSMALLHLFAQTGLSIEAVTVDHGLRAQAADEALMVQAFCEARNIPHTTLKWTGWNGQGNLSAAARDARYALMADWAKVRGVDGIALGHTGDDVAETFLMRLGRKAGVDGLSAMAAQFQRNGIRWARPLLHQSRDDLRAYLRRHDVAWAEDPTNDDPKYARTRARHALSALAPLGIEAQTLRAVSANMASTAAALDHYTQIEAARHVTTQGGDIMLAMGADMPDEIQRRLLSKAIQWIAGSHYTPRADAVPTLEIKEANARPRTVAGCLLMQEGGNLRITREYNAVKDFTCATDQIWDGRWRLEGPHGPELEVRALGETVKDCPDWRDSGVPRRSLMASPAIFRGEDLIAAPLAGYNAGWSARIVANFQTFLLSH